LFRVDAFVRGDAGKQIAVVPRRLTLGESGVDDGFGQLVAKLRTEDRKLGG
jgi:hypothetical protein